MTILGIETSCDETAAAILEQTPNGIRILSSVVASSLDIQSSYGGVFPEQAAREQLKSIIPVIDQALQQAFPRKYNSGGAKEGSNASTTPLDEIKREDAHGKPQRQDPIKHPPIDAIAVTQGPGLIGSLLIGVETAKTLTLIWDKPLIPINHLIAHFYACWTNPEPPKFPALGLLVSGGHTDLVLFQDHLKYIYLGGTRDDAAGECFDKCARLLGLPYPGGPQISHRAKSGNPRAYRLPQPMVGSQNLDLSFSGLKTAVANLVDQLTNHNQNPLTNTQINDLSASIEATITQVLAKKTLRALKQYPTPTLIVAGGVAANPRLRQLLQEKLLEQFPDTTLHIPPIELCTDNGVSTAAAGFFTPTIPNPLDIDANPNLSLSL